MSDDDHAGDSSPRGASEDIALIHGVTPEGDLSVLRKRHDRLELGALRSLREGMPIVGEVVRLTPRKEFPLLCDVETQVTVKAPTSDSAPSRALASGPAQVASDEYRRNWDRIWSPSPSKTDRSN